MERFFIIHLDDGLFSSYHSSKFFKYRHYLRKSRSNIAIIQNMVYQMISFPLEVTRDRRERQCNAR